MTWLPQTPWWHSHRHARAGEGRARQHKWWWTRSPRQSELVLVPRGVWGSCQVECVWYHPHLRPGHAENVRL